MTRRVVVVGASAGGIDALRAVVAGLPADLPAAVLVAVHVPSSAESALPRVLARAGPLPARHAVNGDHLVDGEILVAPPDLHLLVRDDRVRLSRGPRENRQRPAIDPLFRSAAEAHGPGVVAVVLSGALDDGAVGAAVVAAQDGVVLVQDPAEARVTGMPRAALAAVRRARPLPAARIGPTIAETVRSSAGTDAPSSSPPEARGAVMASGPTATTELGVPAALGCPECQGGMYESVLDGNVAYTCHVGHTWSAQTLLEAQTQVVEAAVYNAVSKLMEVAAVRRRLAGLGGAEEDREEHLRAAEEAERRAAAIRRLAADDPDRD